MKKIIAAVLSVVLVITAVFCVNLSVASAATSGNCGKGTLSATSTATWTYDTSTKTLTITGTGATHNYGVTTTNPAPWKEYREEITTIVVGEGITTIGTASFYLCTALTSVSLPSTLKTISGGTADYGAFRECTALENITLPSSLTTIEAMAFKGCSALKSITFPDSLTSLGSAAFRECTALSTVTYGTGLVSTGVEAFYGSGVNKVNFSSTITTIDNYSFFNTKFVTVEIPETVTDINTRAFANCSFMTTATVYNANCSFNGIIGEDPFNGSSQSLTMRGHSPSTTQTYAEEKGYNFESIDECAHNNTTETVTVAPTCTETGMSVLVCDDCGITLSETELAATGHIYELVEEEDASESDGHIYQYYTCTACGNENNVINHISFIEGFYTTTIIKQGSCTTTGIERHTCSIEGCGETENIVTPRGTHTVEEYTVTTEPTCTEQGEKEGVCTVCGTTDIQKIPATGHTNELVGTEVNENNGHTYDTYECTICQTKTVTSIHDTWVDGYYTSTVITNATCTVDGTRRDVCNICGVSQYVTIPANGEHDWYETDRTSPTCTATGRIMYACHNCNLTKSETISALGHNYVLVSDNSTEPTCTSSGSYNYKCSNEGCSSAKTETIPALGHTPVGGSEIIITQPTCEEDGLETATCERCGVSGDNYQIVIPALGHDYVDVTVDISDKPGHALNTPTCSRCSTTMTSETVHLEWIDGYYDRTVITTGSCTVAATSRDTCKICGTTRTNTTPAPGHDYYYTGINDTNQFCYKCRTCGNEISRNVSTVKSLWNINYVNKAPNNSTVTNGYLFDLNNDNIINAKDYAIISKAANS
ncbi:MAG: leucine-rich repeat domain-containing protein [Eubacterium sp.]